MHTGREVLGTELRASGPLDKCWTFGHITRAPLTPQCTPILSHCQCTDFQTARPSVNWILFCLVARRITTNILSDDITEKLIFHVRSCFSRTLQILWQTRRTFEWWATESCIPSALPDKGFQQETTEAVIRWQAKSRSTYHWGFQYIT